jgi:hypothetical protein
MSNASKPKPISRPRPIGGQGPHSVGQFQGPGHLVLGVVVAAAQNHRNAGLAQPAHLLDEEQARVEVLPVAVVHVPGDDDKSHLLFDGRGHQILQGPPGGPANLLDRRALVAIQSAERAVQVKVGSMEELEHRATCHCPDYSRVTYDGSPKPSNSATGSEARRTGRLGHCL